MKIEDEGTLEQEARGPFAIWDGSNDTFSSGARNSQPPAQRQDGIPSFARYSEPFSLSCKGFISPCCNSLDPAKFCRQCALLCAVAPDAAEDGPPLPTLPRRTDLASYVPECVTQQHAGMFLVSKDIQLAECDSRATSFFASAKIFRVVARNLHCTNATVHEHFVKAARATINTGAPRHVLLYADARPQQRYCLILFRVSHDEFPELRDRGIVLAIIQPLDARRVATARQLMELFGLSAAEARLARALARGESLVYYAAAQGIGIPTARSQLRSAFAKTATDRQTELVRLVIGVPPIR